MESMYRQEILLNLNRRAFVLISDFANHAYLNVANINNTYIKDINGTTQKNMNK